MTPASDYERQLAEAQRATERERAAVDAATAKAKAAVRRELDRKAGR